MPLRTVGILALILATSIFGCGRGAAPTGDLRGLVTYQGKPLPGGTMIFEYTTENGPQRSTVDISADGSFKAPKLPVGTAKVSVTTELLKPNPNIVPNAPPPNDGRPIRSYVPIPTKYHSLETSDLVTEVKTGSDTLNIDLK